MEFTPMFYIKNYKYLVRKRIKHKIVIGVAIFLIVLTAYYVIDGSSSNSSDKVNSSQTTIKDSEETTEDIGKKQELQDIEHTNYENMIYKGGTLPLPFPQDYAILTSPFNPQRKHPISGIIRPHRGADIVGRKGTQILSVADGKVAVSSFDSGGYGNWVEIEHNLNGKVIRTRYGHMRDKPLVEVGKEIKAGTVIGIQGQTGGATGEHLHFEVRINGKAVDPLPYLLGKDTIETYRQW